MRLQLPAVLRTALRPFYRLYQTVSEHMDQTVNGVRPFYRKQLLPLHLESKILDSGSAKGYLRRFVLPNHTRIVGIDIKEALGVDVIADGHDLPFRNNAFDAIVCSEVLEHVVNPQKVILEIWRCLQSGGLLAMSSRFAFPIHGAPHDYWRFTRYGLEYLLRNFERVEIIEHHSIFGLHVVLLWNLKGHPSLQRSIWRHFARFGLMIVCACLMALERWVPKVPDYVHSGYFASAYRPMVCNRESEP